MGAPYGSRTVQAALACRCGRDPLPTSLAAMGSRRTSGGAIRARCAELARTICDDPSRVLRSQASGASSTLNEALLTERSTLGILRLCHNAQADPVRKQQVRSSNLRVGSNSPFRTRRRPPARISRLSMPQRWRPANGAKSTAGARRRRPPNCTLSGSPGSASSLAWDARTSWHSHSRGSRRTGSPTGAGSRQGARWAGPRRGVEPARTQSGARRARPHRPRRRGCHAERRRRPH
jgi:hypothetical protein